ncbi:MAG: glycosyltransferase family 2 protein [Pseudomonadota bacterium]
MTVSTDNSLMPMQAHTSKHGRVMAVSMMKDEAPYLLEWFAHHIAIGFTDILVYTNDCSDGTVEMLKRLEKLGLGYHRPNAIPKGAKPQPSAIKHAQNEPLVRSADWVIVFDADEFLCINHPSGHLDGMLDDVVARGANGIVMTWRIFGSSGVTDWSRAPVTEQYLKAAPPLWNKGWGVKTLFKFDPEYWKLGIHRPAIKSKHLEGDFPQSIKWLNGSGLPMEDYFKFRGWRSIRRTLGYNWVQMNHYAVKSIDSYAVRKFRGNVNHKKDKYNADYWSLQDRNEVEDRNILRHSEKRAKVMKALLDDPELKRLHETAVSRVEAKLQEYKSTDDYEAFKQDLIEASKIPITEITAKPPKVRDPAKIAALMSKVEKQNAARPKEERRHASVEIASGPALIYQETPDLTEDVEFDWVENHGIKLPADPRVFAPLALNAVSSGRFDRRNARHIETYLSNCRRVLDIGAGIGFVCLKAAKEMPQISFMMHDTRDHLVALAREIAEENEMQHGATLKHVAGDLVFKNDEKQARGLDAYLKDFRPDVLRVSDINSLHENHMNSINLSTVKRILIPFFDPDMMEIVRTRYSTVLLEMGFNEDPQRVEQGSLVFERKLKKPF